MHYIAQQVDPGDPERRYCEYDGLYDCKPRTPEMMTTWFEAKQRGNYPIIGVISDEGELMGFASYGAFRPWPAYKYTVEHSLYVAKPYRRQGVGTLLLKSTIERATSQDYHVLVGGIDSTPISAKPNSVTCCETSDVMSSYI
jgi:L-amino acid N-acyltransferase YncA